jgi:hypothetical protein
MHLSSPDAPREDPDFDYRSEEEPHDSSADYDFSPQEVFDDWMVSLWRDQRQMLSVILVENFRNRLNLNVKQAATEAGSVVGFNEKTVRRYRNENEGHFSIQLQGKYE